MAATIGDKARKGYSYLQKTLGTGINSSDATATPNNVANVPSDTAIDFVVDRVDSSGTKTPATREIITAVLSGSTFASMVRGKDGTTAQSHLANAVIEFVLTGGMWNDLIDFILADHANPSGYHKTLHDINGNEMIEFGVTTSAVNQLKVTNSATGNPVKVEPGGDDTNADLKAYGKGTGKFYADHLPPQLAATERMFDHVASGGVWAGLGYGTTLTASMTALVAYINGRRIAIAAIATRTFTASKDTYIDVLDNADGTGTIVYTEVANNAASPALASNSMRIAIIQSGATITAVGAVNQGEETKVLPIASSIPYQVTDSLGNPICPRDSNRRILGYRQITALFSTASTTIVQVTGLTVPVIVPTGRKVKLSFAALEMFNNTANGYTLIEIWDGAVSVGTALARTVGQSTINNQSLPSAVSVVVSPSAGLHTFNVGVYRGGGATANINASSTAPAVLIVELV
jgi:hypothetical protein